MLSYLGALSTRLPVLRLTSISINQCPESYETCKSATAMATEDANDQHNKTSASTNPLKLSSICRPLHKGPSQIRLITPHASPDFDSPIECSLGHVNLDERPKNQALSYVWGNPNVCDPSSSMKPLSRPQPTLSRHFDKSEMPLSPWFFGRTQFASIKMI